jgi:hypothetical protein
MLYDAASISADRADRYEELPPIVVIGVLDPSYRSQLEFTANFARVPLDSRTGQFVA